MVYYPDGACVYSVAYHRATCIPGIIPSRSCCGADAFLQKIQRLLRSRLSNLLHFGLGQPTRTARPSLEAACSVIDYSCYTSRSTASIHFQGWPSSTTLCSGCAINAFVKTREPPVPRSTQVGCKSTCMPEGTVVYGPLYMFRPIRVSSYSISENWGYPPFRGMSVMVQKKRKKNEN